MRLRTVNILFLIPLLTSLSLSSTKAQSNISASFGYGHFAIQDRVISPIKKSGGAVNSFNFTYERALFHKPFQIEFEFQFNELKGGLGRSQETTESGLYGFNLRYSPIGTQIGERLKLELGGYYSFQYQDIDYAFGFSKRNSVTAYTSLGVTTKGSYQVGDKSQLQVAFDLGLLGWISRTHFGVVNEEPDLLFNKLKSSGYGFLTRQLNTNLTLSYRVLLSEKFMWSNRFGMRLMKYQKKPVATLLQTQIMTGIIWNL